MFTKKLLWRLCCSSVLFLYTCNVLAVADLCIQKSDWVTGAPVLTDGDVAGDAGYTNATRAELGKVPVTGVPHAGFLRLVEDKDGSAVWIGIEINGLTGTWSNLDTVLLAFSVVGGTDTFIQIQPFADNNSNRDTPGAILFKRRTGSGAWAEPLEGTPSWASVNMSKAVKGAGEVWVLEMKIPKAPAASSPLADGIYFGAPVAALTDSAPLKFYVDVLRTTGQIEVPPPPMPPIDPIVETSWPDGAHVQSTTPSRGDYWDLADVPIPARALWADVSLGMRNQCAGITLAPADIGTMNPDDSAIVLYKPGGAPMTASNCPPPMGSENNINTTNFFKAIPERTNASVTAENVTVTYKIAKWGVPGSESCGIGVSDPGCWRTVASTTVAGPGIPAGMTRAANTTFNAHWQPTFQDSCHYLGNTDNCMTATLSSTNPDVVFINDSVRRNMRFVSASRFESDATISGRGYGPAESPSGKHKFFVHRKHRIENFQRQDNGFAPIKDLKLRRTLEKKYTKETQIPSRGFELYPLDVENTQLKTVEVMTWTAEAYRLKSKKIKIGDKLYNFADEVGGFSYVASHEGMLGEWSQSFFGADLQKTSDPNVFVVEISPGGESVVNTIIETKDYRYAINLGVGMNNPQASFANSYRGGTSFNLGLEYLINNQFSIEGIIATHGFGGKGGLDDDDLTELTFAARYYFNRYGTRYYLTGGVGSYDGSGGSEMGVSVGLGLDYVLARRLSLEASYKYHNVDTSPSTEFSVIYLGLRYLF